MVKKPLKIGVVMDPIAHIKPLTDSTLALMRAARDLGAALLYMEQADLHLKNGHAYARLRPVDVFDNDQNWFTLHEPQILPLTALDVILMRKDPPVDKRFIHTCYMLEQAVRDGVRVWNDPSALLAHNEKVFTTLFPQFCPPYVIGSAKAVLQEFREQHEAIVIKPLDSMGGDGVFLVRRDDVNFDVIWELHTQRGRYPVVAQAFLPEIAQGDKRVNIFAGEPLDYALVRKPRPGSIRGNLASGGSHETRPLNAREREIATAVGQTLMAEGVIFAGLDIIGDYLTEINITSPTGLPALSRGCGINLPAVLMEKILARV